MNNPEDGEESINRFLKHLMLEPDERLILTYFRTQIGMPTLVALNTNELRWVVLNLTLNPSWRVRWQQLERLWGANVAVRPAAKAMLKGRSAAGSLRLVAITVLLVTTITTMSAVRFGAEVGQDHLLSPSDLSTTKVRGSPTTDELLIDGLYYLRKADRRGTLGEPDAASIKQAVALLTVAFANEGDPARRVGMAQRIVSSLHVLGDSCNVAIWSRLARGETSSVREATSSLAETGACREESVAPGRTEVTFRPDATTNPIDHEQ